MKLKISSILSLLIIVSNGIYAQEIKMCGYQGYQSVEEVNSACDLYNKEKSSNADESASIVVDEILDKVGLFRNFLIEECEDINNALAVTMPIDGGDIERFILYDDEFFQKVSSTTGTDWGLTSILAHEVGHHLNGHTLKSGGSNHKIELQADEFSGFVLARMKCSLEDAQSAVSNLLPDKASATHPAKIDRLNAIEKGWNRGNGKTIKVKKIEEVEDVKDITAEQVLANYIDAIGGEENIKKIKTIYRIDEKTHDQNGTINTSIIKSLTPAQVITITETKNSSGYDGNFATKQLFDKTFRTKILGKYKGENTKWVRIKSIKPSSQFLSIINSSYIYELGLLIQNSKVSYKGITKIDGLDCYQINIPKVMVSSFHILNKNRPTKIFQSEERYYDIKTGLLYSTINTTEINKYKKNQLKKTSKSISTTTYNNYKEVNGVLYSFEQKIKTKWIEGNKTSNATGTNIVKKIEINSSSINPEDYKVD